MFGIGDQELIIIVLVAFMLFGPDKLPGMGRTIGRMLKQFRDAQEDFNQVVKTELVDPMNSLSDLEPKKKTPASKKKKLQTKNSQSKAEKASESNSPQFESVPSSDSVAAQESSDTLQTSEDLSNDTATANSFDNEAKAAEKRPPSAAALYGLTKKRTASSNAPGAPAEKRELSSSKKDSGDPTKGAIKKNSSRTKAAKPTKTRVRSSAKAPQTAKAATKSSSSRLSAKASSKTETKTSKGTQAKSTRKTKSSVRAAGEASISSSKNSTRKNPSNVKTTSARKEVENS